MKYGNGLHFKAFPYSKSRGLYFNAHNCLHVGNIPHYPGPIGGIWSGARGFEVPTMHLQILQFAEEVAKEKVADLLCLNMGTFHEIYYHVFV
jgi:hypothetical protein